MSHKAQHSHYNNSCEVGGRAGGGGAFVPPPSEARGRLDSQSFNPVTLTGSLIPGINRREPV